MSYRYEIKYDDSNYKMTALNFSGGKQSSCLLWMILLGHIRRPDNFAVITADPGMEDRRTYEYVKMMHEKCAEAGIEARVVDGPNLVTDIFDYEKRRRTRRLDNPPYWNVDERGKIGRLMQACTKYYKIQPMDRAMRKLMEERLGIGIKNSHIGENVICKWIGFSYDEVMRIKPAHQKYVEFQYPLVDIKMKKEGVLLYFMENDLPIPPRSVCNACFSNGIHTYKDMFENRRDDWLQAVAVDEAIRDMSDVGANLKCYVSKTCLPLARLAELGFDIEKINAEMKVQGYKLSAKDDDNLSCDSGYCFT
jgi:hypothetical protein